MQGFVLFYWCGRYGDDVDWLASYNIASGVPDNYAYTLCTCTLPADKTNKLETAVQESLAPP